MQTAVQAAKQALSRESSKLSVIAEQPRKPRLPIDALERLWLRMATRYGHAWVSQYGPEPNGMSGAEWAETLAGLTLEQVGAGLTADRARGAEWPPSSPMFRALCLGIPNYASVRRAIGRRDGSPFIRLVWSHLDTYAFTRADQQKADRMLRDAYEIAREHVMRGGVLPTEPTGSLEPPKPKVRKPATEKTVRKSIAEIEAALGAVEARSE